MAMGRAHRRLSTSQFDPVSLAKLDINLFLLRNRYELKLLSVFTLSYWVGLSNDIWIFAITVVILDLTLAQMIGRG